MAYRTSKTGKATGAAAVLAAAWERLPVTLRTPNQFLGRQNNGCGATIGLMPRCDFSCRGCYLTEDANRMQPLPVEAVKDQMRLLRSWLGPAGNLQITDGEVTLRDEAELIELIAYARSIGLVPMLMSHGETFRRKLGLLERLMVKGGLTEIAIHIDTTMQGRRDGYRNARHEKELDGLRQEFADMIRSARKHTGRRLEAASTVTVTRDNLDCVPGIIRWFMANADAFKMVSLQPVAAVGRTQQSLQGVTQDELWERIQSGTGNPDLARGEGMLGHPQCSRFVQGVVTRRGDQMRFSPLYLRNQPEEMNFLNGVFDRLDGISFRLDSTVRAFGRRAYLLLKNSDFLIRHGVPHFIRLVRRSKALYGRYFCIVTHHFMNAAEAETPLGRERLSACAFRVPVDDRLVPMCSVNASGLRERIYRDASAESSRL